MENSITNRQMAFMIFLILTSYGVTVAPALLASTAGSGSWLTILLTAIFFAICAAMVVSLNIRFEGMSFFEYSPHLIGRFFPYTVLVIFILATILFIVFLVTQMASLLQADFLIQTPKWSTMLIAIPVFCFIAQKGITNTARMTEIFGLIYLITAVVVHILMLMDSKVENILPLLDISETGRYFAAMKYTVILYVGCSLLYIIPFTKENQGKKAVRTVFITLLCIGAFYVLVVESSIMKVGINNIVYYKDSLLVAIRETEVPFLDFLKRMDILYLTVGFSGYFMGISMAYLVLTEYLCKIFKKAGRIWIVTATGAVSYVLCLIAEGIRGFADFIQDIISYATIFTIFVIPVILLIIARIKKIKPPG